MAFRAREITIAVSLGIHGLIAAAALSAAHDKKARRTTTVSIADEKKPEKKKEQPKPPPPPPAKPKPVVAKPAPAPAAAPTPAPAAPVATAPVAASAPLSTNISLGNDVGMEVGGSRLPGEVKPTTETAPKPKPAAAKVVAPTKDAPPPPPPVDSAGACTEPPGKPEPASKSEIEYTEEARAAGVEGRLVLEATVDADGNVTAVKVISGVDPNLDAAAIATVKTWRFKPARACGKPVAGGTYRIARRFELGN